jgi:hypothetical protein
MNEFQAVSGYELTEIDGGGFLGNLLQHLGLVKHFPKSDPVIKPIK